MSSLDTPPTPSVWMSSALIASNYYLIPVKPDPYVHNWDRSTRQHYQRKRENFDLKKSSAGIVFNMVDGTSNLSIERVEISSQQAQDLEK